eukprot:908927-Pelagomonas_calceolata.AAC.1
MSECKRSCTAASTPSQKHKHHAIKHSHNSADQHIPKTSAASPGLVFQQKISTTSDTGLRICRPTVRTCSVEFHYVQWSVHRGERVTAKFILLVCTNKKLRHGKEALLLCSTSDASLAS